MRTLDATALKDRGRVLVRGLLEPLVENLARLGVHPHWITASGLFLTLIAAWFFARGQFTLASLWAALGAILDALDGAVARKQGRESRFGAFLDSTLDRVSDTLIFAGIAAHYFYKPVLAASSLAANFEARLYSDAAFADWSRGMAAILALAGAYLVSYTRARAEGLGLDCHVGWFERPERLIVLIGAGLFGAGVLMDYALALLVLMSWITAAQRFLYVQRQMSTAPPRARGPQRKSSG